MKTIRKEPFLPIEGEELAEYDLDVYSEGLDDEEAMEMGFKPEEAAFLRGFKKHN